MNNTSYIHSSRQRNFATISALIALATAMLPALRLPIIGSISLTQGGDGVLTFLAIVLAAICIFFSTEIIGFIEKKFKKTLPQNLFTFIAVGLVSLVLLRILYLWYSFTFRGDDLRDNPFAQAFAINMGPAYGLYLTALAILFFLSCIFYFEKVDHYYGLLKKKIKK